MDESAPGSLRLAHLVSQYELHTECVDKRGRTMYGQPRSETARWAGWLDIVGSEIYVRYRKRMLRPGVVVEIRRDYPGLGLLDVLVRVYAARRILLARDDFAALAAIRAGDWRDGRVSQHRRSDRATDRRSDAGSRALVWLGGVLFVVFCAMTTTAAVTAGSGSVHGSPLPLLALIAAAVVGTLGLRLRTRQ